MSQEPQPGGQPPAVPADVNEFNRRLIAEFRANQGRLSGPMAGRSLLLLTTKGARTGTERTAVLGFARDGQNYVVVASNNGAPRHPAWFFNLRAEPHAQVEVGAEQIPVRAREAAREERPRLAGLVSWYERQQALTDREIPFVVLEPQPA